MEGKCKQGDIFPDSSRSDSYLFSRVLTLLLFSFMMIPDVTSLSTDTVVTKAGANLSLACPGVTEHSLVLVLEWYCRGCSTSGGQDSHYSAGVSSQNAKFYNLFLNFSNSDSLTLTVVRI